MTKQLTHIAWYKKTLKKTKKPIVVKNMITGKLKTTDTLEFKNCDIKMKFNNALDEAKACGATTILEVYQ